MFVETGNANIEFQCIVCVSGCNYLISFLKLPANGPRGFTGDTAE